MKTIVIVLLIIGCIVPAIAVADNVPAKGKFLVATDLSVDPYTCAVLKRAKP